MSRCNIIAEVGSVHDGSFGNAIQLIRLAKNCNADAVKFQTHIAEAETLRDAPMPPFFKGEPRYDYFERTSFTFEEWKKLKLECENQNIEFLSSPFSIEAVIFLEKIGIQKYKIPSGEITNLELVDYISKTNKPILISSGMSTWSELDSAIGCIQKHHNNITIMQCTSEYPCSYENVGLNVLMEMHKRYGLPVGFSDHTIDSYAAYAAVTLGVVAIEKHLTFSRQMYGSDAKHSLEPSEFKDMIIGIRKIEKIIQSKVDKDRMSKRLKEMKDVFEKSIVSVTHISKGSTINRNMLGLKKPGTGISSSDIDLVLGKKAKIDIKPNTLIILDHLLK